MFVIDAKTVIDANFEPKMFKPSYFEQESDINKIYLINKIDLLTQHESSSLKRHCHKSIDSFPISCKTSEGLANFMQRFEKVVEQLCGNPLCESLFTTVRHESHLTRAVQHLGSSIESLDLDIAVAAHHLREAAQQISQITGRITSEDVLDVIFKDFCIGK